MAKKKDLSKATPWISAIGLFVLWELIERIFNIPVYVLPTPSESIMVGWEFRAAIWMHALQTLYTTLAGFAIAVVFCGILGALVGSSKAVYDAANPLLVGFNSVPKVALVPVLVMWFGIGTVPAIITAFLISFFPIVVNVATGLATLEPELRDVLRSLGATRYSGQGRLPACDALFLCIAQGRDHAGLCRIGDFGNRRIEPWRRLSDAVGIVEIQHAAGICRVAGDRGDGDCDVRAV